MRAVAPLAHIFQRYSLPTLLISELQNRILFVEIVNKETIFSHIFAKNIDYNPIKPLEFYALYIQTKVMLWLPSPRKNPIKKTAS
jgi:hypothetical protein